MCGGGGVARQSSSIGTAAAAGMKRERKKEENGSQSNAAMAAAAEPATSMEFPKRRLLLPAALATTTISSRSKGDPFAVQETLLEYSSRSQQSSLHVARVRTRCKSGAKQLQQATTTPLRRRNYSRTRVEIINEKEEENITVAAASSKGRYGVPYIYYLFHSEELCSVRLSSSFKDVNVLHYPPLSSNGSFAHNPHALPLC